MSSAEGTASRKLRSLALHVDIKLCQGTPFQYWKFIFRLSIRDESLQIGLTNPADRIKICARTTSMSASSLLSIRQLTRIWSDNPANSHRHSHCPERADPQPCPSPRVIVEQTYIQRPYAASPDLLAFRYGVVFTAVIPGCSAGPGFPRHFLRAP